MPSLILIITRPEEEAQDDLQNHGLIWLKLLGLTVVAWRTLYWPLWKLFSLYSHYNTKISSQGYGRRFSGILGLTMCVWTRFLTLHAQGCIICTCDDYFHLNVYALFSWVKMNTVLCWGHITLGKWHPHNCPCTFFFMKSSQSFLLAGNCRVIGPCIYCWIFSRQPSCIYFYSIGYIMYLITQETLVGFNLFLEAIFGYIVSSYSKLYLTPP